MTEKLTFVKACQDFFSKPPHDRKITIPELKALSRDDKIELREMLITVGYDVVPIGEAVPSTQ